MKIREWIRTSGKTVKVIVSFIHSFIHHMPNIIAGDTHNAMSKWSFHTCQGDNGQTSETTDITSGNEKCCKTLNNNRD